MDNVFYIVYTKHDMDTLHTYIQSQRKKHGMTQGYLASKIGVSRSTYVRIECGSRELKISEAGTLASIFSMSLKSFLAAKEPEKEAGDVHIRVTEKNLEKFRQVLLYVLNEVGGRSNISETSLHALLYFIDFDYYEMFEGNLMGAMFVKNCHGPTSVDLGFILKDMQKRGEIERVQSKHYKYRQKKYLPLVRPNLSILSAQEIQHIDAVLARLSDKNTMEMERYSCEDIPWKSAQSRKPLSYESVFYRDECHSVRNYDDTL